MSRSQKLKLKNFLRVERTKIMLGWCGNLLVAPLSAQTTTRKFGRGATKRPRVESAFKPPKHIQDNFIQRLYLGNLLSWLRLTLVSDLKTWIRVDLDLQLQHIWRHQTSTWRYKLRSKIESDANFEDGKPHLRLMNIIIFTCNFFIRVDPVEKKKRTKI